MTKLRQLAGLGLLALIIAALWFLVISPLSAWKLKQTAVLSAIRAEQARISASLTTLEGERRMLEGDSEISFLWRSQQIGTATAEVQASLSELAARNGISLRSISPLPGSDGESGSSIAFRVESEAALDKLTAFLTDLEHNERALVIRSATLRRLARPASRAIQPELFFQMDLQAPVLLETETRP